jgi:hypothetical protein
MQVFLGQIQCSELEHVFHHGIKRARWVLDNGGDNFMNQSFMIAIHSSSVSIGLAIQLLIYSAGKNLSAWKNHVDEQT